MRQGGPNGRRPRGRHHGGGHNGNGHNGGSSGGHDRGNGGGNPNVSNNRPRTAASLRHQTFDSNCTDLRVRGNAWQVHEKYQALARDAQSAGDRVAAENYLQHAEHYYRIIEAINEATAAEQRLRPPSAQPVYGQQPEIPTNYYGTDGVPTAAAGSAPANAEASSDTNGNVGSAPQAEAQVEVRLPPQPTFFATDESDEQQSVAEPLVARR